ncbi:MAG TPA: IS1 family transposase [Terracidiphilus sp.]|nr:IS1 family transposase [Terracidiphilus sp.]
MTNSERLLYYLTMMSETQTDKAMTCEACTVECQRFGKHRNGLRRFRCPQCKKTYTEAHKRVLDTMYISQQRATLALQLLLEGNSIRSTERICQMDRNTIMSLLLKAGERCEKLMESKLQNLDVREVEVDELWGFVQKKERQRTAYEQDMVEIGDAYCFVAMERNTKLVITHYLGRRSTPSTDHFIAKLAHATSNQRYQLTTDGFKPYIKAVKTFLADRVDFAQLVKVYSSPREGEQRYSPGEVVEAVPVKIMGNPNKRRICTSHIERQNLSIRMGMRRMTRLTNAFSKRWGHLEAAYNLWFAYYNFCRIHKTLRVTPSMEAGITDHVWGITELLS